MKKLFIIFSVLILSGCSLSDIFSKDPELFIDAQDLGAAYKGNDISSSDEYTDKYAQVTGVISYISETKDEIMIQIYGGIICLVTSDFDSYEDLEVFSKVSVNGNVQGLDSNGYAVIVNKCELVEVHTVPEVVTTSVELSSLNTDEMYYKLIEVTGEVEYMDLYGHTGWTLITEDINNSLIVVFDDEMYDFEINAGDTITVIGVFIPSIDFSTNSTYRVFGSKVTNIIHGS